MAERVRGLLRFLSERLAAEAASLASTPRTYACTTTEDLTKNATDAAALLAQRARALHLLSPLDADPKHAAPCIVDFDKAAQTYAAHARALLAALGGPLRQLATPRAAHVLASASRLLAKMSVAEARAPDVGVLESSIESLSSIPVTSADAMCERRALTSALEGSERTIGSSDAKTSACFLESVRCCSALATPSSDSV